MGNQHKSKKYLYNGQYKTIKEIADSEGIKQKTLEKRIRKCNYNIDEALKKPISHNFKDLTNKNFGLLTAIERCGTRNGKALWLCKCECGNYHKTISSSLVLGLTKSCGCICKEKTYIHGLNNTRIQNIWEGIQQRCNNKSAPNYNDYGGRGIKNEWVSIEGFYSDMGDPPDGYTIDRINNNGNYSKSNCRWATQSQQTRNSRQSKRWFVKGEWFETALEAAERFDVSKSTIRRWCDGKWENGKFYEPFEGCFSEYYYPR